MSVKEPINPASISGAPLPETITLTEYDELYNEVLAEYAKAFDMPYFPREVRR